MRKKFTLLIAACALLSFLAIPMGMWGQSDYSSTYSSNVTLTTIGGENASICTVNVSNTGYDGIKVGTSKAGGKMCITVPEGTKYLHIHVAAWNDVSGLSLNITPNTNVSPTSVALTSNSDIANNSPFTFNGDPSTADYYKVITFTNALTSETTFTFTTSIAKRFVIWGVNAEAEGSSNNPSISVNPSSIDFGSKTINPSEPYEESFEVTFANLTENLSVSVGAGLTGVSVDPSTISKDGNGTQQVTVSYNPTSVGSISGIITISNTNDNLSKTVAVTGSAYDPSNVPTYTLYSGDLVEGDYVIYYSGKAMKNTETSKRLDYTTVTPSSDAITNPDPSIVWHIAPDGQYWTIYNAAVSKYAASTSAKNQATLITEVSDNAKWTATGTGTYDFENLARSTGSDSNNKWLRNNGTYGFACYASGTGGKLSLYKLTAANQVAAPTFTPPAGTYTAAQSVTISTTPADATIYYTIDGSTPTTSSSVYSSALSISQTTTVKALAVKSGMSDSDVASATYTIVTPITIAEARALTDGTTVFTSGIVTSQNGTTSYIQDATGAIVVYNSNVPEVGHYITVEGELTTFNGLREIGTSSNAPTVTVGEEGTVTPTVMTIEAINTDAAGSNNHQAKLVRIENATYNNGTVSQGANSITVYGEMTGVNNNDVVTFTANIGFYNFVQLVNMTDITVQQNTTPTVTVTPATVSVDAGEHEEYLAITLQNIEVTDKINFGIYFYESDGTTVADYSSWFDAEVIPSVTTTGGYEVYCAIQANTGEARHAYLKVYVLGNNSSEATSELITINQAAPVVDYATLPFEWEGGASVNFLALNGVTANGLGSDYGSSHDPYNIKFDNTDDYIQVKCDQQPGIVTIGVKMVGGTNNSTITVQGSADGATFTDIQALTISGAQNDILTLTTTNSFAATDRYVRLLFTKGSNVGVGPISIAAYVAPGNTAPVWSELPTPTIAVNAEYELDPSTYVTGTPTPAITLTNTTVSSSLYEFENGLLVFQPTTAGTYEFTFTATNSEGNASATLTVTAAEVATYTLATSITSGRHYVIAASTSNVTKAMGRKNATKDYYDAIDASIDGNTITVPANSEIQEFVIVGPNVDGYYYIYDPVAVGYLYASSSSSNDLSYQTQNNANGLWEIDFTENTVTAKGTNTHNLLRYNSGSPRFSCYTSGQTAIAFYEKNETTPQYDFYKDIAKYTVATTSGEDKADGWYLIATPVVAGSTPSDCGLITDDLLNNGFADNYSYDFYAWDNSENLEWRNYRAAQFSLVANQGYLYANKNNVTMHFTGMPYSGTSKVVSVNPGWNLIGNPYSVAASVDMPYYRVNEARTELTAATNGDYPIDPMEGVFVQNTGNQNVNATFEPYTFTSGNGDAVEPQVVPQLNVKVKRNRDIVEDNAIVRFDGGAMLGKLKLNPNSTKLYFTEGSKDYAIVRSNGQGEMPVNFKASQNSTYTITITADNVEFSYLHLIDNKTGADVDLLATPSYSFEAKTTDYASRFRLVFSANDASTGSASDDFAFFNGSEWVISNMGEATLQVVDVMGRVLSTETVSGNVNVSLNQTPGVYMLRLVNSDSVRTQKIVVR